MATIQSHRDKAYRKINEELVGMYFEIGKYLSIKIKSEKWGSKTVGNTSRKIMKSYPNLRGFNKRGLYRMVQFYETYGHNAIVSSLLTQISWTNNVVILFSTKTIEEKDKKGRFSMFELELKSGVDANDLLIKKAGGSQPIGTNNVTTSIDDGKSKTLTHKSHSSSKGIKPKRKKKGKKNGKS